jgi:hypothetical protein
MRAQAEAFGLAFVVVLLIFGIVVYVFFSATSAPPPPPETTDSFLTALAETDVPACGMSAARVAADCVLSRSTCGGDPCGALQGVFDTIANATLDVEGKRYNLSLEGTSVTRVADCQSANASVRLIAAPRHPLFTTGRSMRLSLCR